MDELRRCEHCQNRNEIDEVYKICDFCIEIIEGEGEGEEEVQYWNEWVKKRRL